MRIGGLQKFSLVDYPGKLSCVIFTQGCNFRCPYCFNPQLVIPEMYESPIAEDKVLSFLERRRGQLDGVVITGGEPTVHEDLPDFLKKIHSMKYLIKLDTNGSHLFMLQEIIRANLVDYIAMDIKALFLKYNLLCGIKVNSDLIKESISLIIRSGVDHEFRTTAVKPLLSFEDLEAIARLVRDGRRYFVQAFIPHRNILDRNLLQGDYYMEKEILDLQRRLSRSGL